MIERLSFLLGTWELEYHVPKSRWSKALRGSGRGVFRKALGDKHVFFDYSSAFDDGSRCAAHGVFAEDRKNGSLRYWWFEDSGTQMAASCRFEKEGELILQWEGGPLTQSFKMTDADRVLLTIYQPSEGGGTETIMEVLLRRTGRNAGA